MKKHRTHNYLRTHRRRAGLSQDDIAFLLGTFHGTRVSRHERGAVRPPLAIAFAYEIIFGVPANEILEDDVAEIERAIIKRAETLFESLEHRKADGLRHKKRRFLREFIDGRISGSSLHQHDHKGNQDLGN